ncbi:MAG: sulfatase-like hydrolase/transferase [Pseudomonadota bacterium]
MKTTVSVRHDVDEQRVECYRLFIVLVFLMSFNRPLVHRIALLGLFFCFGFTEADADGDESPPNILIIYVDDLGYGDLGSFGHPVIETPHLDALAADGMTLTSYYAPSPLCSPSRAALLTGRHPYRTGIRSWIPHGSGVYLRDHEITLPELLKDEGYATALVGKWHLNSSLASRAEPQPTEQGFDYFFGHNAFQIPTSRNPINIHRGHEPVGEQEGYIAEIYVDEAVRWLTAHDDDQPFLLMFNMAEPHTTFENPPEFNEKYREFINGEVVPIPSGGAKPPIELLIPRGPGEYYANVTYMDHQIGRLLSAMRELGLYDDTVIVFASDNGPVTENWRTWWEVNAHGSTGGLRGRKHRVYEGGIRVPAILRVPGITQAGSESDEVIIGTDLFTTLATLVDADIPTDRAIDGIDISDALAGDSLPPRSLMWALEDADGPDYAIRKGSWKLLLDDDQQPVALYNLDDDPLELLDVSDAHRDVVQVLSVQFQQQMMDIDKDPLRPR